MKTFNPKPSREIGILKEAILDGQIANDYDEAYQFMLEKAKQLGLQKAE